MKTLKNILYLIFILIFSQNHLFAQDNSQYAVSRISNKLLNKANVVIRVSEETFTIESIGKGKLKVKKAYTILNEKGDELSELTLYYDQLSKVSYISANLYDATGKKINKLKKSNIKDYAAFDGVSFVSDNRVKNASLSHHSYPYTVEFEYETTYNGLMFYPNWNPYSEYRSDVSVEKTTFTVISPKDLKVRYKEFNLNSYMAYQEQQTETSDNNNNIKSNKLKIIREDNLTKYTWHLENLGIFKEEAFNLAWWSSRPFVRIAPTDFEIEGYKGNMSSWQSYGKFIYQLNKGRGKLPEETINKIKELTKNLKSPLDKAKAIYKYLQSKTRYVSIQLGLGGWQPFPAKFVDEKGYGDCKALTNYTRAMLEEVGVNAYYTLVRAGNDASPVDKTFPSASFNHAFLCVPMEKDTVWLECTSQTEAFGYIGDFTGDRDVLLITPEGGKLVHTTAYQQNDNLLDRKAQISLANNGDATAKIQTHYGALQEGYRGYFAQQSEEKQKKWLYEKINIPSFEIESFSLERIKSRMPVTKEILNLKVRKCAAKTGKRLFLKPNLMNKWSYIPNDTDKRTQAIYLGSDFDFKDIDNLTYHIPKEYKTEYLPKDVNISSRFGSYQARFKFEDNKLIYTREVKMNKGTYPAESYQELREFYQKVVKADKVKVVFVEKE